MMNNLIFEKRIGNVAFMVWSDDKNEWYNIEQYSPNWYYYHKDDFMEEPGNPGFFVKKTDEKPYYSHVNKSCFKNEETRCVIARFKEYYDGDEIEGYNVITIGDRPVSYISHTEDKDFMDILRYAFNYLKIKLDKENYEN